MGPPPPRRSVAPGGATRGQTQPRYHQDLAYYDLGPGPASGPVQQQPGGPGVNERVREWMLDVERHSGADQGDQRSQHSKTANMKTSPRSNRMKSGGHQERLMSTSWSQGGGYPGGQMSGPPSGDEKRRLAASLVMPPPSSQANTLRRSQPAPAAEVTVAGEQRNMFIMKRVFREVLLLSRSVRGFRKLYERFVDFHRN